MMDAVVFLAVMFFIVFAAIRFGKWCAGWLADGKQQLYRMVDDALGERNE